MAKRIPTGNQDSFGKNLFVGNTIKILIAGFAIGNYHVRTGMIVEKKGKLYFSNTQTHIHLWPLTEKYPLLSDVLRNSEETRKVRSR
jgi:hypothetical protein